MFQRKGDLDRAIADFTAAIKIQPGFTAAYVSRGNAYQAKGEREKAAADYKRALAINPNLAAAKDGLKVLVDPARDKTALLGALQALPVS